MARPIALLVLACALCALTVQVLTYQRVLALSQPATAMIDDHLNCLTTIWCSTGGDPEFPCTKISRHTCPMEGETEEALKARHKARVLARMAVWPKDCSGCLVEGD